MKQLLKLGMIFISFLASFAAGIIILYLWQPFFLWYWNYRPVLGVDFYNSTSMVGYLSRHFALRFSGWNYMAFGGFPMQFSYPSLHAYLNLPLLSVFSLPQAVQAYMLGACFLYFFFSFLLFAEISRNKILALVLSIAIFVSIAPYGALVWGGSLPYFATQFFLPLTLWLLFKYFSGKNKNWLYLSALALGISFFGHPQVAFSYIIPISFLLLFFYPLEKESIFTVARLKKVFVYFLIAVLIGYPQLAVYFGHKPTDIITGIPIQVSAAFKPFFNLLTVGKTDANPDDINIDVQPATASAEITTAAQYDRAQLSHFITETNPLFFVFAGAGLVIFLLSAIIRRKRKESLKFFVYLIPVLWVFGYGSLLAFGIAIFQGGWYRVFWAFPLAIGIFISYCWADFWQAILERISFIHKSLPIRWLLVLLFSGAIAVAAYLILSENWIAQMIVLLENPRQRQQSSAYPDALNVDVTKSENDQLIAKLTPQWLDPNNTQYRLYEADQRVNIWWPAYFDMPLFKGYTDSPSGDTSGAFYWTAIALTKTGGAEDSLVQAWGTPEEMAYNNALFLVDWYSLKYLEGEHERSDSYNLPTSYLADSDVFSRKEKIIVPGWADLYPLEGYGRPIVWRPDIEEYLTYYEVDDKYVSPIIQTTNVPVIGVIGAQNAYYTIMRDLAAVNKNSQQIIPLQLGQFIDNVSLDTLKEMDAIILYAYNYKNYNRSWGKIEQYLSSGGKVFIETGGDVKETNSGTKLPAFFPINSTKKEAVETSWQSLSGSEEIKSINLKKFGPPLLNDNPWPLSVPASTQELRENSVVILKDKDRPLIVSRAYNQGEVIWSGMDLPNHLMTFKNQEEAKLMQVLLDKLIPAGGQSSSQFTVDKPVPEKNIIRGSKARGVLFKEQDFDKWTAKIKSESKSRGLNIYRTGPTYPGFMYVIIPQDFRDSEFEVIFNYHGFFWGYFWNFVSLLVIILIFDKVIFKSFLFGLVNKLTKPLNIKVASWWGKEDDY